MDWGGDFRLCKRDLMADTSMECLVVEEMAMSGQCQSSPLHPVFKQ